MIDGSLFGTHDYLEFLLAAIALNLVPGQDTLYIIGRSLAHGRRAGIVSVLGIGTGCLIHITAAALGLYAILALWPGVFLAITLLGGLYLIWLGISTWRHRGQSQAGYAAAVAATAAAPSDVAWTIYRQGLLTNLTNPKVALFFLAFLPGFIDPGSPYGALSFLFLGGTFLCTGTAWCMAVALSSSAFADALRENPKVRTGFDLFASLLFIGLGIATIALHA